MDHTTKHLPSRLRSCSVHLGKTIFSRIFINRFRFESTKLKPILTYAITFQNIPNGEKRKTFEHPSPISILASFKQIFSVHHLRIRYNLCFRCNVGFLGLPKCCGAHARIFLLGSHVFPHACSSRSRLAGQLFSLTYSLLYYTGS